MNKSDICDIIQDLLPNYIEHLTTEKTNIFIEEHLKDCNVCKTLYNTLIEGEANHKTHKEVSINFMKKYRNILYTTLVACILFIGISAIPMTIATVFYKDSYNHLEKMVAKDKENLSNAGFKVIYDETSQKYYVEDLISGTKFRKADSENTEIILKEDNYEE